MRGSTIIMTRGRIASAASILAVLAAWLAVGQKQWVDPLLLPGPLEVLETGKALVLEGYRQVALWQHVAVSLARAMSGSSRPSSRASRWDS
jgi:taurine transport system permease protein